MCVFSFLHQSDLEIFKNFQQVCVERRSLGELNLTYAKGYSRCLDELDTERLVVDCLADDNEHVVDWDAISCNRHAVRHLTGRFKTNPEHMMNHYYSKSSKKKSRAHSNLANRNLAPLK